VASQEAIKELGTNGGGFSTPTPRIVRESDHLDDWIEIFLLLVISFSLAAHLRRIVGSRSRVLRNPPRSWASSATVSVSLIDAVSRSTTAPPLPRRLRDGGCRTTLRVADSAVFAEQRR